MKITYGITVCNEYEEIQRLVSCILKYKDSHDEVIILLDHSKTVDSVIEYLRNLPKDIITIYSSFTGNFAEWKNIINKYATGDYIFQIDADELPHENLITNLHNVISNQPNIIDLLYVPRINTVEGITDAHISHWNWKVETKFNLQCINFPDYQSRIYRRDPKIIWHGKIHERITGMKNYSMLPPEEYWCLYHHKTIARQEIQNSFYELIST